MSTIEVEQSKLKNLKTKIRNVAIKMRSKRWHIQEVTVELVIKKQNIIFFIFKLHYFAQDRGLQIKFVMKGRRGSKV
jgi:hypothetical protein